MQLRIAILWLCMLPVLYASGSEKDTNSILFSLDPVVLVGSDYSQRLVYETELDTIVRVRIDCYYISGKTDSIHVYDLLFEDIRLKAGAGYTDLLFSKSTGRRDADFLEVVRRFRMVPAGVYHTRVVLFSSEQKDNVLLDRRIVYDGDSTLGYGSGLRSKLNAAMALPASAKSKAAQKLSPHPQDKEQAGAQHERSGKKLQRQLRSTKGLELRTIQLNGKSYSEAWYKQYFLGRYELGSVQELSERAGKERAALGENAGSLVSNELENFRSVGSQFKELNSQARSETKVKGQFDMNTYRSTAQDPQSAVQQNYTELNATMDLELMGLPFSAEGFYTSQDAGRKAKASYFRIHYDLETAKNKLQKSIDGYKSKLNETVSKGAGLESVYGNYAQSLDKQKASLLKSLSREYGVSPEALRASGGDADKMISSLSDSRDTGKLLEAATDKIPGGAKSSSDLQAQKQKLQENKKDLASRYQKILELEQKAARYYQLLDHYRKQTHLDSAINYQKIAGLDNKAPSYKDMSKAAAGILPEGKAKSFITGLTSLDAGIINKYESSYTMAGQTLKGLSMGYDLGAFKTGITLGSTEYISREGTVDHYSTMLLRVDNKGSKNHKIGLLYNLSSPANSMSLDENFIGKQNIRYPGFSKPTQILSVVYEGKIGKHLQLKSESASSFKSGQQTVFDMAHAALNHSIAYNIPKTTLNLNATWEHLGSAFENNTLPYIRSGTERYTLGTTMDLFQSFLSLKLDYNYLVQQSFSSTGYNRKWGIDLRTHSRRYPTVSLSYKPFSTFRSLSDTLQVARRPIQGEVWTARSSYQVKRNKIVHRFTLLFNRNSSSSDTLHYTSSTAQAGYSYTDSRRNLSLTGSLGRITLPGNYADGSGMISSYTAGAGLIKGIGKTLSLSLGPDIALCSWGIQRLSGTVGLVYRLQHYPFAFRTTLRYSAYRLSEAAAKESLYAGQFGMSWQFKSKSKVKT